MWILVIALVVLALVAAAANRLHGRRADGGGRADAPGVGGEAAGALFGRVLRANMPCASATACWPL